VLAENTTKPLPVTQAPPLAMTIREFCQAHNISMAFFYLLQQRGEGPRVMKLGSRRLIAVEEAARWRQERTAVSA
jgi:predicted DNA-binding transcriptional regulator AlpA